MVYPYPVIPTSHSIQDITTIDVEEVKTFGDQDEDDYIFVEKMWGYKAYNVPSRCILWHIIQ